MSFLITASLATGTLPNEIVYIPEGDHQILPYVDGKPQDVHVSVPDDRGEAIVDALNRDLAKREIRAVVDFDHKSSGPAAAIPTGFRYERGKGIMLALEWTGAGKAAVEGKDFSYFSPTFLMADDKMPGALTAKGPIGSLVNEPAFRKIPRIAASDASNSMKTINAAEAAQNEALESLNAESRRLVAAGEAKDETEGMEIACGLDSESYKIAFQTGHARQVIEAGEVRKDTEREIEKMREDRMPGPKEKLDKIAEDHLKFGTASNQDEAFLMAVEANPEFYQASVDQGAEMLADKGGDTQSENLEPITFL